MNLVSQSSQFLSHLGCYDTTAAIARVTGDTNFHVFNSTFPPEECHWVLYSDRLFAVEGFSIPDLNERPVILVQVFQCRQEFRHAQVGARLVRSGVMKLRPETAESLHLLAEVPGNIDHKGRQDVRWQSEVENLLRSKTFLACPDF